MIDFRILTRFGSTNERLREIFKCKSPPNYADLTDDEKAAIDKDLKVKKEWEGRIAAHLDAGAVFSIKNAAPYQAVDMAWDSVPITKEKIPLVLYAQGKLDTAKCVDQLNKLSCGEKYIVRNEEKKVVGIDLPKFFDVEVNLIRSFVTRRVAAQAQKYGSLYPFYKYESRSTSQVGKLRSDVWSQRTDIMADQFGYRHDDVQVIRDTFLYGHCANFVRSSWERDQQLRFKPEIKGLEKTPGQEKAPQDKNSDLTAVIEREGVGFDRAHPSREFHDQAYPLSSINTDSGCEYAGYWGVVPWRTIKDNPDYFNREDLNFSSWFTDLLNNYPSYFNQYFDRITPPDPTRIKDSVSATVQTNARTSAIGSYSTQEDDASILLAYYFAKIVPIDWGIGEYAFPVWVRFIFAGTSVVYAEFLPSTPGAVSSHNENDARMMNVSFAMELMPFQDQMSNLLTQLLSVCQQQQVKVFSINKDILSAEDQTKLERQFRGLDWYSNPVVVFFEGSKLAQMGLDKAPIVLSQLQVDPQSVTSLFTAMTTLVQLVERLESMSPNESGQPIVRGNGGVTATEAQQIESTTNAVFSFASDSIDEYRAAKKRILFESYMACGKDEMRVPVVNRYPPETIKLAGLKPYEEDGSTDDQALTVTGSKRIFLEHDFIFTTRDGSERESNTQTATTLIQLMQMLMNPLILPSVKKSKFYEIINEAVRRSGAGIDLNLELLPGEDEHFGGDNKKEQLAQIQQIIQQIIKGAEGDKAEIQGLDQKIQTITQILDKILPQQPNPQPTSTNG
jgi:hypothetical protein